MSTLELQNFYPDFVPNQILTNTQLNSLRVFLDEQNRITRTRLIGMGISCGLHAKLNADNSISVSKGFGITSHGYFIELKDTHFVNHREYVDPYIEIDEDGNEFPEYEPWRTASLPYEQINLIELLSDETLADPEFEEDPDNTSSPITKSILTDKVLVLYLELLEEDLKSCLITDCNNKGMNLRFRIKALLVAKDDLDTIAPCPGPDNSIFIPRLISGLKNNGIDGLHGISSASQINNGYKTSAQHIKDQLSAELTNAFSNYKDLLQFSEDTESKVTNADSELNSVLADTNFNQYHYDYFVDIATAYNEFVSQVCILIKNCCPEGDFPRHLALRDFTTAGSSLVDSEQYRNVFEPSPVRDAYYHDVQKTKNLFLRILSIIEHFQYEESETIKITPSQIEEYNLGKRALPYYYQSNGINKLWQPKECCTTAPLLSFHLNEMKETISWPGDLTYPENPLLLNLHKYSLYRIEGHIKQTCQNVYDQLYALKKTFNLEFDILKLNTQLSTGATTDPELIEIENLIKQIEDLETQIQDLIEEDFGGNITEILSLFQEIELIRVEISNLNTAWQEKRKLVKAPCSITHLQEDYLILRSEVLCTCAKIQSVLDSVPSIDLGIEKESSITMNEMELGKNFGAELNSEGDHILEEKGARVSVEAFKLRDGTTQFNQATIQKGPKDSGLEKVIQLQGINLKYDFSKLEYQPEKIRFVFIDSPESNLENISINGSQVVMSKLSRSRGRLSKDITLSITPMKIADVKAYEITISGPVKTFEIGGENIMVGGMEAKTSFPLDNGYSRENATARVENIKKEISAINKELKKKKSELEIQNLTLRKNTLEREMFAINRIETISDSSEKIVKDIYLQGSSLKNISQPGESNIEYAKSLQARIQTDNPLILLIWGLLFGIIQLKQQLEIMCKMFPKDVRAFNYPLFIKTYKEVVGLINQIRLLIALALEFLVAASAILGPVFNILKAELWKMILGRLPQISDYLNAYNSVLYKCVYAQLATVYYSLEYTLNKNLTFAQFAEKNHGMTHLAGVEKGGTFILVCEEDGGENKVVADFALSGKTSCCCELNPDELCLPPISVPEYRVIEVEGDPGGSSSTIDEIFDVIKNDIDLNGTDNLTISLVSDESELGGALSIETAENGRNVIRYVNENDIVYGLDSFKYVLTDENCNIKDEGEVLILVKPKIQSAVPAIEDIAVTPVNHDVDIDVVVNDLFVSYADTIPYNITIDSSPVFSSSTVEVLLNDNGRQIIKFKPERDFIGRDVFTYELNVGSSRTIGAVTVLVIPCCGEQPTTGVIVGPDFTGVVLAEGEPLPAVNITIKGTTSGAVTDLEGFFRLGNVPVGNQTIVVSAVGFQNRELEIIVQQNGPNRLPEPINLTSSTGGGSVVVIDPSDMVILTERLKDNMDVVAAENKIRDLFAERYQEKITVVTEIGAETGIVNEDPYKAALEFMRKDIQSADVSMEELTTKYSTISQTLLRSFNENTGATQKAYKDLITAMTHSYMDRLTIHYPEELDANVKSELSTNFAVMKENNLSPIGIRNSWAGKNLESELKINSVTELNKLMS